MTPILSAPTSGSRAPRAVDDEVGGGGERAAGVSDDRRRAVGDRTARPSRSKSLHAEFFLQLENLAAEGRLADVAGHRGAAEMAVIRDGGDIVQISEIHDAILQ